MTPSTTKDVEAALKKTTGAEPRITNSSGNVARESLPQKRQREIAMKVGREAA